MRCCCFQDLSQPWFVTLRAARKGEGLQGSRLIDDIQCETGLAFVHAPKCGTLHSARQFFNSTSNPENNRLPFEHANSYSCCAEGAGGGEARAEASALTASAETTHVTTMTTTRNRGKAFLRTNDCPEWFCWCCCGVVGVLLVLLCF